MVAPSFRGDAKRRTRKSRDSPMCNRTSEVRVFDAPRNDGALRDAGEEGLFRGVHGVGGSHMHPHAIEPKAEQPLLLVGAIEYFG